jgi:DNA-binding MarR family transcriptional regulator
VSTLDIPCYAFTARHASRHLSQFYERMILGSGIHAQQFTILAIINHKQPLTITELAEAMAMDRTTLTRSLSPLERDGKILIANEKKDRRNRVVTITAQGKNQLDVAAKMWRKAQAEFESRFGVERAANLREELRAAADAVSQ